MRVDFMFSLGETYNREDSFKRQDLSSTCPQFLVSFCIQIALVPRMESPSPLDFLKSVLTGVDHKNLKCCDCDRSFKPDDVLARTLTLQGLRDSEDGYTQRIEIPALSESLLIYHRHLDCLFDFGRYITVSHVWDPLVASLQADMEASQPKTKKSDASAYIEVVAKKIRETPTRVCQGLAAIGLLGFEIWHDYITVPQWEPTVKLKIIHSIPQIYARAKFTTMHLHDVHESDINAMRSGNTEENAVAPVISATQYFSAGSGQPWSSPKAAKSGRC